MKYSQNPFKTQKTVPSGLVAKNARLLVQSGFIHQEVAGVYTILPLGLRVLNKIENIIREEMDKIGVEVLMSTLAPVENWQKTGRFYTNDVLMKTTPANDAAQAKNDTEYVLGPTQEEIVTPLVQEFARSYKDLPASVYQIQTKYRNEPRAKSGLLRCREFRMKDMYSFHANEEDLKKFYEQAREAYWNVFERLGIGKHTSFLTLASGGDFTTDFSHEFQTVCDAGEDLLFHIKSKNITYNREIAPAKAPVLDDSDEEIKPRKDVEGKGIIGVEELAKFLKIPVEKTTKTILFENEKGEVVAAAVRGGYDINEEKLLKITGDKKLVLASPETVKKVTKAEVGYAGLLNLPNEVRIYMDESMKSRKNFEMGANKTHYHSININFGRDIDEPKHFYDFKIAKEGDAYPDTGEVYEVYKAAEVGNIFPLNVKFSKAFGYTYTDQDGSQKPVYMGCYGIGSTRLMGVIVEKFADDRGHVWPNNIAPFQVHLVSIREPERADKIYKKLQEAGIEVLYDDREDVSAGAKFADADLIGIPVRLVVSAKTGEEIEWKQRKGSETELVSLEKVLRRLGKVDLVKLA
jgi:prolyl-tRNA synthetase